MASYMDLSKWDKSKRKSAHRTYIPIGDGFTVRLYRCRDDSYTAYIHYRYCHVNTVKYDAGTKRVDIVNELKQKVEGGHIKI